MEDPHKSDNLCPKINESQTSFKLNNSEFKIEHADAIQEIFIVEIHLKETISQYINIIVNIIEFFNVNLVVLSS